MKIISHVLLVLSCWCALFISSAQAHMVEVSAADLNTLEENCKMQQITLEQSLTALEEARLLLMSLGQGLTESEQELTASQEALTALKTELSTHKAELVKLKLELSKLRTESTSLSADLQKANQSLKDTEAAYKKESKKQKQQTRLWQVIAIILGGITAAK